MSKPDLKDKSIKYQWDTYRLILSKDAGATQIIETRRAFYAGAQALFYAILTALEPGSDATDNDLAYMDKLDKELRQFAIDIKNGVA